MYVWLNCPPVSDDESAVRTNLVTGSVVLDKRRVWVSITTNSVCLHPKTKRRSAIRNKLRQPAQLSRSGGICVTRANATATTVAIRFASLRAWEESQVQFSSESVTSETLRSLTKRRVQGFDSKTADFDINWGATDCRCSYLEDEAITE
jgi:hypothetical protein